jgi:hypothetical protein
MAKNQNQLTQLQRLLKNAKLRKQIRTTRDERTVFKRIITAGASEGFTFSELWLKQAFDDIKLTRKPLVLSERELLALAGDADTSTAACKLCHTDSCGGGHAGCC